MTALLPVSDRRYVYLFCLAAFNGVYGVAKKVDQYLLQKNLIGEKFNRFSGFISHIYISTSFFLTAGERISRAPSITPWSGTISRSPLLFLENSLSWTPISAILSVNSPICTIFQVASSYPAFAEQLPGVIRIAPDRCQGLVQLVIDSCRHLAERCHFCSLNKLGTGPFQYFFGLLAVLYFFEQLLVCFDKLVGPLIDPAFQLFI